MAVNSISPLLWFFLAMGEAVVAGMQELSPCMGSLVPCSCMQGWGTLVTGSVWEKWVVYNVQTWFYSSLAAHSLFTEFWAAPVLPTSLQGYLCCFLLWCILSSLCRANTQANLAARNPWPDAGTNMFLGEK